MILKGSGTGTANFRPSNVNQATTKSNHIESVRLLASEGNERLTNNDPHTCCFCRNIFNRRDHLKNHLQAVHCKTTKISCDLCPKFFFTRDSLSKHMTGAHGKKRFACDACDFKTSNSTVFKTHKLIHSSKVECPVCKKQVNALKVHMVTHIPKDPCKICGKEIHKKTMKLHMKVHKQYDCGNCLGVFNNKEDLRRYATRRQA